MVVCKVGAVVALLVVAAAVSTAIDIEHAKSLNANSNTASQIQEPQTLVRVHIKQSADPQFPVRPPAPPPQPPARLHPSLRLEPYAGGAVTQAAKLEPSVMGTQGQGSCGAPPCCGSVPCSSMTASASGFTPYPPSASGCNSPPCCGSSPCSAMSGGFGSVIPPSPIPNWTQYNTVPPLTNSPVVQEYTRTVPGATLTPPLSAMYPPNPVPLRVEVNAASITQPVTANVGWEGDRRVGVYSLDTSPNVRIIGEDTCGCPAGVDPCNDPCNKPDTPREQIENKLDEIKSQIVEDAEKIKDQNLWIKQVKTIIKHYNEKIASVSKDNGGLQAEVKRLFGLKKHYEDLLLQYELDQEHFKKVEQWHSPDEIVVTQVPNHPLPSSTTNTGTCGVEADTC